MGWWMVWGSFLWIIFIAAVVFIAAKLAGGSGGGAGTRAGGASSQESPLDIARRRYAAGEISREEFEQIRRDLS